MGSLNILFSNTMISYEKKAIFKHQYLRKLINNILHNKNKFYLKIYFLKKWVKRKEGKRKGRRKKGREREREGHLIFREFPVIIKIHFLEWLMGILVHFESPGDQCWISVYSLGNFTWHVERVGLSFIKKITKFRW